MSLLIILIGDYMFTSDHKRLRQLIEMYNLIEEELYAAISYHGAFDDSNVDSAYISASIRRLVYNNNIRLVPFTPVFTRYQCKFIDTKFSITNLTFIDLHIKELHINKSFFNIPMHKLVNIFVACLVETASNQAVQEFCFNDSHHIESYNTSLNWISEKARQLAKINCKKHLTTCDLS